jgi:hypothetical protein
MKNKVPYIIWSLAFLFLGTGINAPAQEQDLGYRIPDECEPVCALQVSNAGFREFASSLEQVTGVRLYYRDEWVHSIRVDLPGDSMKITDMVARVLRGSGLVIQFLPPDRMIVLKEKIQVDLSHLTGNGESISEYGGLENNGLKGGKFLEGTHPEQILHTIVVGEQGGSDSRTVARIRGRIRDIETGEPVIGATMVVTETGKGSISDQHGNVILALPPGSYNARFSFVGMETVHSRLVVHGDGEFQLGMNPAVIALNEVEIVGDHYRVINSTDVGVERLSMSSVKQMPLFMGENDVIRISRLLPGITSAGEASVGVNVRGGNADQNIFYINRVPVYNTSHMFGFLSAFNSDIIKDFSVYKASVPVNFGGRISSVFNILTRKGNQKKFHAHAGISPVSAHATLETPLVRDRVSLLVSGRTSYSDWMLKSMEDPVLRESQAGFYDFSGSLSIEPNEKNDLGLFYYQSYDRFAYGSVNNYEYANRGGSVIWKHTFTPALISTVTLAGSGYTFASADHFEISRAYRHRYNLAHNEFVSEFSWMPALNHRISFGSGVVYYYLDRGEVRPDGEASLRIPVDLGTEKGVEGSLFASDDITLLPWLSAYAGLRYSFFGYLGPGTVRIYDGGPVNTEGTLTDTLQFGNNELIESYSGPEVRLAVNLKAGQNTSFKVSFSQMRQYLFMLSNTVTISPTDQWKLSDYHLSPPSGNQYSAGFHHIRPRSGISASIELYYKHTDHVVEYRDGANFIASPYTETAVLQGQQNAYGAEFMLQRTSGRLNGWINYAWSRSIMQVQGEPGAGSINRGEPYPSNYDRPHVLNVVGNARLNRRLTFSSNMVYMTGRPVTFPASLYYIGDVVYIDYHSKNQFRVPDYFRIDASLSIEGNLKADKLFHSSWSLNVYNLLGRNNPQSLFFEPKENYLKGFSFSVIGVPVFTLSWNIKLGNYESS